MVTKSNNSTSETPVRKAYQKPALVKVAVLSAITAMPVPVSSSSDSANNYCWVARAAFGEADLRWMIFRAWLLDDAPAGFRRLYIRYGEAVGNWLAGRDSVRAVVRAMMMPTVNRKVRGWQLP